MGRDNTKQFQYDATLIFKSERGSHSMEVPCIVSIKVKDQSPGAIKGTAWINSALEPKSKAWLYCKFSAHRSETCWQVRVEGDDLAALVAERLDEVKG